MSTVDQKISDIRSKFIHEIDKIHRNCETALLTLTQQLCTGKKFGAGKIDKRVRDDGRRVYQTSPKRVIVKNCEAGTITKRVRDDGKSVDQRSRKRVRVNNSETVRGSKERQTLNFAAIIHGSICTDKSCPICPLFKESLGLTSLAYADATPEMKEFIQEQENNHQSLCCVACPGYCSFCTFFHTREQLELTGIERLVLKHRVKEFVDLSMVEHEKNCNSQEFCYNQQQFLVQ